MEFLKITQTKIMNSSLNMLRIPNHKISLRQQENTLSKMRRRDVYLVSKYLKDFWKKNFQVLFDFSINFILT